MNYYLRKYVGKYRVVAEYDKATLDFPRTYEGDIDPTFADIYIKCANDIRITHSQGGELFAIIPSKQRGCNILKEIWTDKVETKLPKEPKSEDKRYLTNLCKEIKKTGIIYGAEVLDQEVIFFFKDKDMDYMAKYLKPRTSGASISPFSKKNLPKSDYKIPKKDEDEYKKIMNTFPKRQMGDRTVPNGILITKINKKIIKKHKITEKPNMKAKQTIHSNGLWDEYLTELRKECK